LIIFVKTIDFMIQRITLILLLAFICQSSFSQVTEKRKQYIKKYRVLAISEMQRSGIPASITLAQACLESNNGMSILSRKSNNHFGVKCKSTWRGIRTYYDDDSKNECFRKYASVKDSYKDHTDFLMNNPRYASLFKLDINDYKGWAYGLKKAGYATNPVYAESLIRIIENNKLYKYDQMISHRQLASLNNNSCIKTDALSTPSGTQRIILRNGLKSVAVKVGDSMSGIAKAFNLKVWQLQKYNDYPSDRVPVKGEILYVESKRRKTGKNKETYTLGAEETMHYVSQMYGIKLSPLYRRNHIKKGTNPKEGTIIYLRHKNPKR